MDFNKFTVKLQEAVETANQYAGEQNHSQLEIAHILVALLAQKEGIVRPLIDKIGVSSSTLEAEMRKIVDSLPKAYGPVQRSLSQNAYDAFNKADNASDSSCFVTLMLGIIRDTLKNTDQVSDQVTDQVDTPVQRLLSVLGDETLPATEIMKRLGLSHRPTFRKNYLDPALEAHLIERTIPDKPNSSKQEYRRTQYNGG